MKALAAIALVLALTLSAYYAIYGDAQDLRRVDCVQLAVFTQDKISSETKLCQGYGGPARTGSTTQARAPLPQLAMLLK